MWTMLDGVRALFSMGERLSSPDRSWLRMERPENLMNVTALFAFDGAVTRDEVLEHTRARLLALPRFRAHLDESRWPRWSPRPARAIDLDAHLVETRLPGPGGDDELRTFVSRRLAEALPRDRPLWQVDVVQNYRGGTAVLVRVHHSVGDGIALMLVFLSLTELEPTATADTRAAAANPLWRLLAGHAGVATDEVRAYLHRLMPIGVRLMMHREPHQVEGAEMKGRPTVAQARALLGDLVSLAVRPPDTPNRFHGPLGVEKSVAWSAPIPLDDVKRLRAGMGGTVNDIVVTLTAGALRRYLIDRGERPDGQSVRASIPVNLRQLAQLAQLGNEFGLVFLDLPVGIDDPAARLDAVIASSRALKRSPEALVTYGILQLLGVVPRAIEREAVRYFSARATAVLTNVPGPEQTVYFGAHPIRDLMFWVPQSGDIGLGISIMSYAGRVRVGFSADRNLVPDPQALATALHAELDALMERVESRREAAE